MEIALFNPVLVMLDLDYIVVPNMSGILWQIYILYEGNICGKKFYLQEKRFQINRKFKRGL